MPSYSILVGAMATVDHFGRNRIPFGKLNSGPPANELVPVVNRGFPSSSMKNYERSYLP
jgi:hypothetical protein